MASLTNLIIKGRFFAYRNALFRKSGGKNVNFSQIEKEKKICYYFTSQLNFIFDCVKKQTHTHISNKIIRSMQKFLLIKK